jgi:hypothetical protein
MKKSLIIVAIILIILIIFFAFYLTARSEPNAYERVYEQLGPDVKSAEVCQKINGKVYVGSLWSGGELYLRSSCFQNVAIRSLDETLCNNVVKKIWLGYGSISSEDCRTSTEKIKNDLLSNGHDINEYINRIDYVYETFDWGLILKAMGYSESDCAKIHHEQNLANISNSCKDNPDCFKKAVIANPSGSLDHLCYIQLRTTDEFKQRLKLLPDFSNK